MKIHAIIDHPNPASFNYSILKAFLQGARSCRHSVDVLDLNADNFNPVVSPEELGLYSSGKSLDPRVRDYQSRLMDCEALAFFFPIWWMVMPARLKGWMDKVLLPGFAFSFDLPPKPLLTHITRADVFTTTAVADDVHRQKFNNALDWVLCKGTLEFVGISTVRWHNFGDCGVSSRQTCSEWLEYVARQAAK